MPARRTILVLTGALGAAAAGGYTALSRRSRHTPRADRGNAVPPWWLKPMNKVLIGAQSLGLGMRELPVLTVAGRRSGQPRRTPLTVLDLDGQRFLLQGYPSTDWVANVRAAGNIATLTVAGNDERVRLVELDREDALPVLRAWPVRVPQGAKIMRDAGVISEITPEAFEALVGTLAVFRVEAAA